MTAEAETHVEAAEKRAVAAHRAVAEGLRMQREHGPHLRDAIRELRAYGKSHAEIAALLGVSRSRAQQLARNAVGPPP